MRNVFLVAGTILPLISSIVYIHAILRRNVRPQRMTRLLMMVISALSFAALVISHDMPSSLLAFTSFLPAIVLWVLSIKRGIGGRDRLDFVCFALCCAGLVFWLLSGNSYFGLVLSVIADLVACVPSLVKTARLPHTELISYYFIDTVAGCFIALVAERSVNNLLYPLYLATINGAFAVVILWARRSKAPQASCDIEV